MQVFVHEDSQDKLESYLYNILMGYGALILDDVTPKSDPIVENQGDQESISVFVDATDDGEPISGLFSVIKKGDKALGVFTWMHDLDKYREEIETLLDSVVLE
jgi:hypothetical protein